MIKQTIQKVQCLNNKSESYFCLIEGWQFSQNCWPQQQAMKYLNSAADPIKEQLPIYHTRNNPQHFTYRDST